MQYRTFGKDGWKVSVIGFGAMRLPVKADHTVDEEKAIRLIRDGIDRGINYVDTAYIYHGGASESIVGRALSGEYREKARVATKCPLWVVKTAADFERVLDEQLQRLDMEHIDYYMFHGIGQKGLEDLQRENLFAAMERARARGKIGHIGFSFHDNTQAFKNIVDAYDDWDFCQIQYNYMDIDRQAGTEGFEYAAQRDIPIIVMEPLLGGRLANPPADVAEMMTYHQVQRTPAEWALRWLWNHEKVATVLSGMNTAEQLDENCKIADSAPPNHFSRQEHEFIKEIRSVLTGRAVIPCTRCDYCKPCPENIDIGWLLELYNDAIVFDNLGAPMFAYNAFVPKGQQASDCTQCGICEERCPQQVPVTEWMPKVHKTLAKK